MAEEACIEIRCAGLPGKPCGKLVGIYDGQVKARVKGDWLRRDIYENPELEPIGAPIGAPGWWRTLCRSHNLVEVKVDELDVAWRRLERGQKRVVVARPVTDP